MDAGSLDSLIGLIYAGGYDRSQWPRGLDAVAAALRADVIALKIPARRGVEADGWRIVASSGLAPEVVESYNLRWCLHDPWLGPAKQARTASAADLCTVMRCRDHATHAFVTHFAESAGLSHGVLAGGAAEGLALAVWRRDGEEPGAAETGTLHALWPHVRQAVQVQQLEWRPDPASTTWADTVVDALPFGVLRSDTAGRIRFANRAARRLLAAADGLGLVGDGLVGASQRDTKQLREAIRDARRDAFSWLRLTRPSGKSSFEIGIALVADPGGTPELVIFVADPDYRTLLAPEPLQRLFGLTRLEAEIAARLAQGMSVHDVAQAQNLSLHTIRWYVLELRHKLGAATLPELVRRLMTSPALLLATLMSAESPSGET